MTAKTASNITASPHKPLRQDIKLLGQMLGDVIAQCESPALLAKVEEIRKLSKLARKGDQDAYRKVKQNLARMNESDQAAVARAFTEFLRLANTAEQFHRIRRRRAYEKSGKSPQAGSLATLFKSLNGKKAEAALEDIVNMEIDLVFTAHPTEAMRPSAIRCYRQIAESLDVLSREGTSLTEKESARSNIQRTLLALWNTNLFREEAPTPFDEVLSGLSIIEEEVWPVIPRLMRKLGYYHERHLNKPLPLECAPVRLSSWMGGDRDGNPNVTHKVTRKVLNHCLFRAASLYLSELNHLAREYPFTFRDEKLIKKYGLKTHEPYRELFNQLIEQLESVKNGIAANHPIKASPLDAIREVLVDIHASMDRQKCGPVASGRLEDLIRRTRVFGPALLRLDIRQNRDVHQTTVAEILSQAKIDYLSLDDEARFKCLEQRVFSTSNAALDMEALSETAQEVLATIRLMAEYPRDCFGLYIISMAESANDILEVLFMQRLMGIEDPIPVAPLFETPDSLAQSEATLRKLYENARYRKMIQNTQHVMLGYSDSSKRAGKFASAWTIFQKQLGILELSQSYGVEPIFFHGRGGTIGRGGGPIALALKGLPRGQKVLRLRVTEQGESIHAKFGLPEIALRTFELYLTGLLESVSEPPAKKRSSWASAMQAMANASTLSFRNLIYDDPQFLNYYTQVTPAEELGSLSLGSRPAKRKGLADFDALRAIPWIFSWTQNRFLIPTWFGVREALETGFTVMGEKSLREMYKQWPFFASTIDLIEMALAKVDITNVQLYSDHLVEASLKPYTPRLIKDYNKTVASILKISGHKKLIEHNLVLARSIEVRNPYVQVLNLLQVLMLATNRSAKKSSFGSALPITISGISAGMKNTG